MEIPPRLTAALAFAAFLPVGIYAAASGEITPMIGVVLAVDLLVAAGSIVLMFGESPAEAEQSAV
jgi:hypothetical protein